MSIATEEARSQIEAIPCLYNTEDLRSAYIAGRTADVTDTEVKAAMNEWDGHGYCCCEGDPIVCMCGAKLKDRHEYDTHLLRAMLEAARQVVMA